MVAIERLTVGDLAAFWAESDTSPMQIGLVGLFDEAPGWFDHGRLRIERLQAEIERRSRRVPVFRRRVRWTRFGEGLPVWVADEAFDVRRHVTATYECVGMDRAAFEAWAGQHALDPLDRAGPLWRMVFAPGVDGHRVGLLLVVHHVAVDGLAGVAALTALLDRARSATGRAIEAPSPSAPTRRALVRDNAASRLAALRTVLRPRRVRVAPARDRPSALSMLRVRAPRTPLSGSVGPARATSVLHLRLDRAAALSEAHGVTLNDLALGVVTAGLREWLLRRAAMEPGLTLRTSMPIAVPGRVQNESRMVVVPLPVSEPDPERRLVAIAAATAELKSSGADVAHAQVTGSPLFPVWLARLLLGVVAGHGSAWVNCYVTNVRGPADRLELAGVPLVAAAGIAPLVAGVRLGVTVFSYAGELAVTLLGDGGLPEWPVLVAAVDRELAVLAGSGLAGSGVATTGAS